MTGNNKPKILLYDIETMANLAWVWGKYEQDVIAYEQEGFTMSISYKWLGEKQVYFKSIKDFKGYKPRTTDNKKLIEFIWNLFNEADILVAHNGNSFDEKTIVGEFIKYGMKPPEPYKLVDTKLVAKKYARYNSNKLDDLGERLGLGRKVKHEGWDMWYGCYNGKKKYWDMMKKYNDQDVLLLEKVYLRFLPYMTTHPKINPNPICNKCNSNKVQRRGKLVLSGNNYKYRYQCQSCGGWFIGEKIKDK